MKNINIPNFSFEFTQTESTAAGMMDRGNKSASWNDKLDVEV